MPWWEPYTSGLVGDVHLVGSTISCEPVALDPEAALTGNGGETEGQGGSADSSHSGKGPGTGADGSGGPRGSGSSSGGKDGGQWRDNPHVQSFALAMDEVRLGGVMEC